MEDFEKKEKDLAKPVDTEIDDFVESNPRLFDKAFVSTNEEVQVGLCCFVTDFYVSSSRKTQTLI